MKDSQNKLMKLKDIRLKMGMTQNEFAEFLGKSRSSIAKKEAGKVSIQIDELRTLRENGIDLEKLEI